MQKTTKFSLIKRLKEMEFYGTIKLALTNPIFM